MSRLQVNKMAYGGSGFGRLDGKACFVPFTAPGDLVDVRIDKCKSSYSEGVIEELVSPSDHRVLPLCPAFGVCGGCNWQHISYDEQCRQKENIFADTLWRIARVESGKIQPILSAVSPFEYRQRIQLKVNHTDGRLSIGFNRRSSHYVVDINDRCVIAAKSINTAIPAIREIICSFKEQDKIPQVDVSSSTDGSVSALFHYIGNYPESLEEHLALAETSFTTLHSVSMQSGRKSTYRHVWGPELLKYMVPSSGMKSLELCYSPESFSQVNFSQNRIMVQTLLDYCSSISPGSILDLFCGNGNFSLPLASMVNSVTGFESMEKSISLACHNAVVNGVQNARYICMDSAVGVEQLTKNGHSFDLVIMDPPRTGADEVSKIIKKVASSYLIYISCDPPTLARDISTLRKTGFEVITVQPVDMFPQTYHLESIVFLKVM